MNKPKIEIYTKTWCPYCRRAKAMLKSLGLDYTDYDITDNEELQQEMVERSGKKTIPQIFINDQKIGGYDDLIELVSSGGLDDLTEFERPNCSEKDWDLAVIGAGPAGMTASVYAARKGLKVLMAARDIGGQVLETDTIDNYLPEYGTSGPDLMQNFLKHLRNYKIDTLFGEEITDINPQAEGHILLTKSDKKIKTKAVLIAAGTKKRQLGVPGEHQLKDNGVSYCATCDGYIYENQPVAVVGGGNSGLEAALDMAKIATEVYLIIRGEQLSGDKSLQDKVNNSDKIEVCKSYQTTEIKGEQKVESIRIKNLNTGKERELNVKAIFIEIGLIPNTGFICEHLDINQGNEIIIDANNQTSIEGIFAAGDVTDIRDKQIIVSAAEGAKAALRANEYLN
ncbi:MAG: alkyl hydroperoxide reductase subunit F [Halanaerobium sp. 4-GBenrich]|jgi:alkyl hydroperoxide reductase subunit F|uniref:Alkyl hydroperoxide reductase subunit F n=7 Tax=Halanaerobium congolense TaxID=54121 RepID=A0A1G6NV94_9FIRM|nr:glutaredoxin 3 [Halanaerobium congolense]ODS50905.1 MAG: alkyl hydroperoxide reductase subunit F [Halanaerobium sp. 4-GBenrich]PTX17811.1 alkyl hydroperoxide reductase subunit F [Halanaerobium congolense]TDX43723.1 alkyl hydroperoxide reductase subunit F [Halanaerobium congolense]SDC71940.1 alkyl hydroperoxide reductase subunit F [Halanaerobium congolense]SDH36738.1 alkyl hydroperoxide reductase subunit F [Halanaerobium congolense]